jgi:hypothetical protein
MENFNSIFKKFDAGDVVSGRIQTYSFGMWDNGAVSQSAFFISENQTNNTGSNQLEIGNGAYYWDVYDKPSPDTNPSSQKYFSIAYGNYNGSGSGVYDTNQTKFFPSKAVYTQYKNFLLAPEDEKFTVLSGNEQMIELEDFYVINFATEKYKDRLDAGQFELTIVGNSGEITLIDDSPYIGSSEVRGRGVFNLISGSIQNGPFYSQDGNMYDSYGLLYPNNGVVILNPAAISTKTGLPLPVKTASTVTSNGFRFQPNQSILLFGVSNGQGIQNIVSRGSEFVPTRHYFIRAKNQEFNYSNNPTFVNSGSEAGEIKFESFIDDPKVYITSVGLYDENNDLIAVAKLSQPLLKSFDTEALIKIALSW